MRKLTVAMAGVALASLLVVAPPAAAKRTNHTTATTTTSVQKNTRVRRTAVTTQSVSTNANTNTNTNANTNNGSTVAIIPGSCDSLTDGDNLGCMFSGNIDTSTSGNSSYLLAQGAYNAAFDPDIMLSPLATFDSTGTSGGISLTLNAAMNGGTFTLAPGVDLLYYAVKSGNNFFLYQFTGTTSFSTDGLQMGNNTEPPTLSHIIFFGDVTGGVPEPATWAMLLLGLGMVGSSMRRRRNSRSVVRQLA